MSSEPRTPYSLAFPPDHALTPWRQERLHFETRGLVRKRLTLEILWHPEPFLRASVHGSRNDRLEYRFDARPDSRIARSLETHRRKWIRDRLAKVDTVHFADGEARRQRIIYHSANPEEQDRGSLSLGNGAALDFLSLLYALRVAKPGPQPWTGNIIDTKGHEQLPLHFSKVPDESRTEFSFRVGTNPGVAQRRSAAGCLLWDGRPAPGHRHPLLRGARIWMTDDRQRWPLRVQLSIAGPIGIRMDLIAVDHIPETA